MNSSHVFSNPDNPTATPVIFNEGLAVFDGDWVAFKIASALEKKTVRVFDDKNNFVKEYKTRTKFKEDTKNYNASYTIEDCQSLPKNYQDNMAFLVRKLIKDLLRETGCNKVLIALGQDTNFRKELHLPQKYKGNRDETIRPLALSEVREFLANTYPTIFSVNEEADDIISKYQFLSYTDKSKRIVAITLDKDARGTPGYLYNPDNKSLIFIDGLGFLRRIEKISPTTKKKSYKLYGEGRKWFYSQLLTGDKADHYYPCDYYKILKDIDTKAPIITDLKCFNMLNPCTTDKECWKVIIDQYKEWYGTITDWVDWQGNVVKGTWLDILQMYVDVVHMRRFDDDRVIVKDVLKKLGLVD